MIYQQSTEMLLSNKGESSSSLRSSCIVALINYFSHFPLCLHHLKSIYDVSCPDVLLSKSLQRCARCSFVFKTIILLWFQANMWKQLNAMWSEAADLADFRPRGNCVVINREYTKQYYLTVNAAKRFVSDHIDASLIARITSVVKQKERPCEEGYRTSTFSFSAKLFSGEVQLQF